MIAVLPFLFLVLAARWLASQERAPDRRGAFLLAAVATGAMTVAVTEALSLVGAFHFVGLATAWLVAVAVAAALLRPVDPGVLRPPGRPGPLAAAAVAIALVIGAVAVTAPPNTWDAMTYHMARVAHWAQGEAVAFHPTSNSRQNELNPFAEFAIAHLYLLSRGDRLANAVQWGAMAGSWMAVSRIAAQIGASRRGQGLAVLFIATLPMGILQGSSTQNDWVAAFWLLTLASFTIDLGRHGFATAPLLGAAGALGLGVLTKGTVPIYALAPLLGLLAARWRDGARLLRPAAVGLALAALLNLGHAARNVGAGGSAIGPSERYRVERMGPRLLVSNVARNLSLHVASPWGAWNDAVDAAVRILHGALRLDVDPPETTYRQTSFAVPAVGVGEGAAWTQQAGAVLRHEDHAGNPLHLIVILLLAPAVWLHPRLRRDAALRRHVLVTAGAFVCFCAVLRWQPWHSRLHLPAFALAAPFVGAAVARLASRRFAGALATAWVVAALPWLLAGLPRSVLGESGVFRTSREAQYLASRPQRAPAYLGAAAHLRASGCRRIGLVIGGDSGEYPLFALLAGPDGPPDLFHLVPDAASLDPLPCAVVTTGPVREQFDHRGTRYTAAWHSPDVIVLQPADSPR